MYNLSVFIYLNHIPLGASRKLYGLKSLDKIEISQTNFKIQIGRTIFFIFRTKASILRCNLESIFYIFITLKLLNFVLFHAFPYIFKGI